jgi:hypothetical protein
LPYAQGGKNIIPNNKDYGNQYYSRKKEFPFFIEPDLWMEGKDKWNNYGKKIDE